MRRALIALTATLALSLAFGASAQAKCGLGCLNHKVLKLSKRLVKAERKVSSLSRTVSQQGQAIAAQQQTIGSLGVVGQKVDTLYECLYEVPNTQFGVPEEEEGYLYENGFETFATTALDVPYEGEPISFWSLIDGCNPVEVAGLKSAKALAPPANLNTLLQPQRRLFP